MDLNEILQQRKVKLHALQDKGLPVFKNSPALSSHVEIGQVLADFQAGAKTALCGRVMAKRLHGKVTFLDLMDGSGKIQLYLKADIIGEDNFALLDNLDLGDILMVKGELFKTHTEEPTVKAEETDAASPLWGSVGTRP